MGKDWNAENLKYAVLTLENVRNMANILEEAIKSGAHGCGVCSSIQLAFYSKAQVSQFTQKCTVSALDYEDYRSESKESEAAEKYRPIKMETTALLYTRVVGRY